MTTDPVQAAVERSSAAMVILDKHKGACEPHFAMLCETFGPAVFRVIICGAVEAAIIAYHRQERTLVIPFGEVEG